MRPKLFLICYLALSGCASAATKPPQMTVCILDAPASALECYDPEKKSKYSLELSFSQAYVCIPPDDFQKLALFLKLVAQ